MYNWIIIEISHFVNDISHFGGFMEIIDRILLLLEQKNISAAELTREISLTNGLISQWKKGKQKPSTEAIIKLSDYFGVTTDYLLLGNEDTSSDSLENIKNPLDIELLEIFHQLPPDEKQECLWYLKGYLAHSKIIDEKSKKRKKA